MRPTWEQVRQFCIAQGYKETRSTHYFYTKVLPDRQSSRTMVSFGDEGKTVPSEMWRLVWKRQLKLATEDDFWNGLDGLIVQYDIPPTPERQLPLPEYLLRHLRDVLHWPEESITETTRDEAQELLNAWYARELLDP